MTPLENNKTTKSYEDRKNTLKKKARGLLYCLQGQPDSKQCRGEAKAVHEAPRVFETWDPRFDYLPEESLMDVLKILERQSQVVDQVVGKEQTGKKRKILHDKIKSKTVGDVNTMETGLITRNFLDVVGLNHQTNSYTGNHSDISSFLGKNSGSSSSSDFHTAVGLELKFCDEINATSGKYRNLDSVHGGSS
ncbi:hypothetical protein OIU77_012895 [Salix suchowensis]|uniref:Uncharacterized protein n=1 Tax=Salix suchowensis TaxID=1278906 RepID=A0ABQ9A6F7_9ROSI|nr:hypothetical protein OIU77_012895 [Salix suchowensis]